MRRLGIALGVLAALLGGAVAAAYVYDTARADVIAEGARAAGVDLGGLAPAEARAKLERELGERLDRPVRLAYRSRSITVSPSAARVRIDADATVARALRESEGNFLTRTVRDLAGLAIDVHVPAEVEYSRAALRAEIERVVRGIERPARDAKLSFRDGRLHVVAERDGLVVRDRELERAVAREVTDLDADGVVPVRADTREAKVTRATLAAKHPRVIVVSRQGKKLRFYERLALAQTYPIAVGQAGLETPAGLYEIESKAVNPAWQVPERPWAGKLAGMLIPAGSPQNPIEARWMEFHDGAGIHGTDDIASLGEAASHGCIRMAIPDVIELYERVRLGTPVYIA
ncbi:MAG: L,D-transpeptidase/peptidoglycan binding protein [Actinomycetota bacterium]|nr:L,D-transpeptidase/peptidoglycan binding protein [Actinomycetota bacterium]